MTYEPDHKGLPRWQAALLQRHRLGTSYLETALRWFMPLVDALAAHQKGADRPILVGINGSQGSGKTTASDFLCTALQEAHQLNALALSLDDFYLSRAARHALAAEVHPLLATRGVPGTHDMALLAQTLDSLLDPGAARSVRLPRFDKAVDDQVAERDWDSVQGQPDVVLIEGWCLGATPQSDAALRLPVNELERLEDPDGVWRQVVNDSLRQDFPSVHERVDQWIMLKAPSFDSVYRWRQEQEHKLAAARGGMAEQMLDDTALHRFIQHFERLTRHCLTTLPPRVHHLYTLDPERAIQAYSHRLKLAP